MRTMTRDGVYDGDDSGFYVKILILMRPGWRRWILQSADAIEDAFILLNGECKQPQALSVLRYGSFF